MSKRVDEFSMEELRAELIRRRNRTIRSSATPASGVPAAEIPAEPPSDDMAHLPEPEIYEELKRKQKVVYGGESRKEVVQAGAKIQELAESVCAIFFDYDVVQVPRLPTYNLVTTRYGDLDLREIYGVRYKLCPGENFIDQPAGPIGTAFLVADDIIATAGHMTNDNADPRLHFSKLRFVFGYMMKPDGTIDLTVPADRVFEAEGLVARDLDEDWALLKLKRSSKRPVLQIRRTGKIKDGQSVSVIGHGARLPMKYADEAVVLNNNNPDYFIANLDAFGGNSGSPVFNEDDYVVEGIVIEGEEDYEVVDECLKVLICPEHGSGCSGEHCCRTTLFSDKVPVTIPPVVIEPPENGCPWCALFIIIMSFLSVTFGLVSALVNG